MTLPDLSDLLGKILCWYAVHQTACPSSIMIFWKLSNATRADSGSWQGDTHDKPVKRMKIAFKCGFIVGIC